jgi:hypothetical protein
MRLFAQCCRISVLNVGWRRRHRDENLFERSCVCFCLPPPLFGEEPQRGAEAFVRVLNEVFSVLLIIAINH